MKKYFILFILSLAVCGVVVSSYAAPATNSVMSKSCDEAKMKELAGDALLKIEPKEWAGGLKGFIITIETDKLTMADLTKKMLDAGCFNEPAKIEEDK